MLIAEDLLLLLTDDESGKVVVTGQQLDLALGGAHLLDLSLDERVTLDDRKRLQVRDASPTGDPLLDRALEVVASKEGKKPQSAITPLSKKVRPALYERLVASGILRAEHGTVLGIFPTHRWPTNAADHEAGVRRDIAAALVQGTTPTPRTGALVALLVALQVTHKVVPPKGNGLTRRELTKRAKAIAQGEWASAAVRKAIDDMTAAVMVAVTASTAAAASS